MPSTENAPPFLGALLRLGYQRIRGQLQEAIHAAGFTDLQEAHFVVLSYPPPEGERPSAIARRIRMSRQATNHLLGQVEALGYIERRATGVSDRRLVFLTDRGRAVCEVIHATSRALHADWAEALGSKRFAEFLAVLRQVADVPPRLAKPPDAG